MQLVMTSASARQSCASCCSPNDNSVRTHAALPNAHHCHATMFSQPSGAIAIALSQKTRTSSFVACVCVLPPSATQQPCITCHMASLMAFQPQFMAEAAEEGMWGFQ